MIRHINKVLDNGNAILVHSMYGMNRSVLVISAYLMYKYHWCAQKTQQFIQQKKRTVGLRESFYKQLQNFEKILRKDGVDLTKGWCHKARPGDGGYDEMILNNTYLNSMSSSQSQYKVGFLVFEVFVMLSISLG